MSDQSASGGGEGSTHGRVASRDVDIFDAADEYRCLGDPEGETLRPWADEAEVWAGTLHEAQLFLLVADGEDLLNVAAERIARSYFSSAAKYILHVEQPKAREVRIDHARQHARRAARTDGERLLIINATRGNASAFLDNLLDSSAFFLQSVRASLAAAKIWVLVCALREHVEDRLARAPDLPSHVIPVLRPAVQEIAHRAPPDRAPASIEDVEALCRRLEVQQRAGHWSKRDGDLYQQLRYVRDLDGLSRMLDEREQGGIGARCREQARKLLHDAGPIAVAALYVATFFDDPTLADFDNAVRALLADRTERREVPRKTTHRAGDVRTVHTYEEKSCVALWHETRHEIFRASSLAATSEGSARLGGERLVRRLGFVEFKMREAMADALLEHDPWIHHHSLKAFRRTNLLYTAGYELRQKLVKLLVDVADVDRDELFTGWLWPSLEAALSARPPEPDGDGARPGRPLDASFDVERHDLLVRQADLLGELLQKGQRGLVDRCLDRLLDLRRFADLLELVWSMHDRSGFDELQWLQRLIENERSGGEGEERLQGVGAAPKDPKGDSSSAAGATGPAGPAANSPSPAPAAANVAGGTGGEERSSAEKARHDDHGAEGERAGALARYLDGHWTHGRDSRSIRKLVGDLLDWGSAPRWETKRLIFTEWYLVKIVDEIVATSFMPRGERNLEPVVAALVEDPEVVVAGRLLRFVLHPDREPWVDQKLAALRARGMRLFKNGSNLDENIVLANVVGLWLLPEELFALAQDDMPGKLFETVVLGRLMAALVRVSGDLARGEQERFPRRHFYHALCIAGLSVLVAGDSPDDASAERVRLLASAAGAASEPLQHKRIVLYLGAIDDVFADALTKLGEIARPISPSRHDALRARLLRMRQAVRGARTHFGSQPPRDDTKPIPERA